MSFSVYHGATNISSYVIDYQRTKRICNGIGEITIVISKTYADLLTTVINPYDEITLYEDDVKKGTYFIAEFTQSLPDYHLQIKGQDRTKQLADYFISDHYEITYPSTSKYWIEKFLVEAGIPYNFIADETGHEMSLNTFVGQEYLYDLLQRLCLENGWYFISDENNEIQIGKLIIDYDTIADIFEDTEITDITYNKDDKMLRNRIIIRGNADPIFKVWVIGEVKVLTPWNYDAHDYRTAVLMSPNVPDVGIAQQLANQVLDETRKITEVKGIEVPGFLNLECGQCVYISSEFYSGAGLITTLSVKVDSGGGIRTLLILDERCPRLFGYYAGTGDVYIGTSGAGVWRKPLKFVHDWEDHSTGLTGNALYIRDLHVAGGNKVITTDDKRFFYRTPLTTGWTLFNGGTFVDEDSNSYAGNVECETVSLNKRNGTMYAGYNTVDGQPTRSWIVTKTGNNIVTSQVTLSGIQGIEIIDIDHDDDNLYINSYITTSGTEHLTKNLNVWPVWSHPINELSTPINISQITSSNYIHRVITGGYNDILLCGDFLYQYVPTTYGSYRKYNYKTETTISTILETETVWEWAETILYQQDILYRTVIVESETKYEFYLEKFDFTTEELTKTKIKETTIYESPWWISFNLVNGKLILVYAIDYYSESWESLSFEINYLIYDIATETLSEEYNLITQGAGYYRDTSGGVYQRAIVNNALYGWLTYYDIDGNVQAESFVINSDGTSYHLFYDSDPLDILNIVVPYVIPDFDLNWVYTIRRDVEEGKYYYTRMTPSATLSDILDITDLFDHFFYMSHSKTNAYFINIRTDAGSFRYLDVYSSGKILIGTYDLGDVSTLATISPLIDDNSDYLLFVHRISYSERVVKRFNLQSSAVDTLYTLTSSDVTLGTTPRIRPLGNIITINYGILYTEGASGGSTVKGLLKMNNDNSFTLVANPNFGEKVECSSSYPLVLYPDSTHQYGYANIYSQPDLSCDNIWIGPNQAWEITDARIFSYNHPSGLSNCIIWATNYINEDDAGAILLTDTNFILTSGVAWGGMFGQPYWYTYSVKEWITFSGTVTHLETSNYSYDQPYILVSTTLSGEQTFYQKDARNMSDVETQYIERNNFLPSSTITVIRLDDRV